MQKWGLCFKNASLIAPGAPRTTKLGHCMRGWDFSWCPDGTTFCKNQAFLALSAAKHSGPALG